MLNSLLESLRSYRSLPPDFYFDRDGFGFDQSYWGELEDEESTYSVLSKKKASSSRTNLKNLDLKTSKLETTKYDTSNHSVSS